MTRSGTVQQWYRFLEVQSDEDAVSVLCGHMARLDDVYANTQWVLRSLAGSPGGEVEETLRVALTSVGEAIEVLDGLAVRFRAGERDAS